MSINWRTNDVGLFLFCKKLRFSEEDILEDPDAPYDETIINPSVALVIKKAKCIATFFHKSSKACDLLEKECQSRGFKYYRLVQSVVTRWNSLYMMLKQIDGCFDCINFVLYSLQSKIEPLTENDRAILTDMLKCLAPFDEATTELSGEQYITVSLIIPNVGILS